CLCLCLLMFIFFFFFFSSRRRHTRWPRDWSSDVCSSDLDVVHELWRGDRTLCVWRQAVRPVDVQRRSQHTVVSPDGNLLWIRKVGIGLSEGELKREAVETGREFVHQRRRKIMPVADCQIL